MKLDQIKASLRSNSVESHTVRRQLEAFKTLHDAAAFAGDGQLVAQYRENVIRLIEKDLDLSAASMSLARMQVVHPDSA